MKSLQKQCAAALLSMTALGAVLVATAGFLVYRGHARALNSARSFTMAHLHSVGAGDLDAAMQHYGREALFGPKSTPERWRANLAQLRGLRKCEEYHATALLWHGSRGLGWYAHVSYYTAYTNQASWMAYEEMFDVFCPIVGTNCVIIYHMYD